MCWPLDRQSRSASLRVHPVVHKQISGPCWAQHPSTRGKSRCVRLQGARPPAPSPWVSPSPAKAPSPQRRRAMSHLLLPHRLTQPHKQPAASSSFSLHFSSPSHDTNTPSWSPPSLQSSGPSPLQQKGVWEMQICSCCASAPSSMTLPELSG